MKKILSILLVMLAVCVMFASCGDEVATTTAAVKDSNIPEGLPSAEEVAALGYAGDFKILVSGNYAWDDFDSNAYLGKEDPTVVDQAIYERNEMLKAAYGINVVVEDVVDFGSTTKPGNGPGFQKMYTEYMSSTSTYAAASIGTYDVAALANYGLLWNLKNVPGIDLTKDYWDQKAEKDLSVLGKLYYTTGDIGVVNNKVTHAILFNKDMVESYGMENPYDIVHANGWTLEKFTSLVKQVGEDLNQNGAHDENDLYGLLTWNDPMVAILSSSGEKIAGVNEKGEIEYTLMNERVVSLYDKFCNDLVFDFAHSYNYQYDSTTGAGTSSTVWDTNRIAMFNGNRAVFYLNTIATIEKHRDSDVNFGVLPYPKLDAAQADYGHGVSPYHSQFVCVPLMTANPARSGLVLEYLAATGKTVLRPAYYDITLEGKSIRDVESAAMLDIIIASRVYDIGAYYDIGTVKTEIGRMFTSRRNITNIDASYGLAAKNAVETLNKQYKSLQY